MDYHTADRDQLLRMVITNPDTQTVDDQILEDVLCDRYFDFVKLCEEVESTRSEIKAITSKYENGQTKFEIQKK